MIQLISTGEHDRQLFAALCTQGLNAGLPCTHRHYFPDDSDDLLWQEMIPHGLLIVWNGCNPQQLKQIAFGRQRGLRLAFAEHGWLPRTTQIDPLGVNARCSIAGVGPGFYRRIRLNRRKLATVISAPLEQRWLADAPGDPQADTDDGQPLPERYILLVLQVHDDSQIRNFSPHFRNMESLISAVTDAAAELNMPLVIKEHPSDYGRKRYAEHKARVSDHLQWRRTTPVAELLPKAALCVTINSSVGADALRYGIRVMTCGEAVYAINGVTSAYDPLAGMAESIQLALVAPVDIDVLQKAVYYWGSRYLLPVWAFGLQDVAPWQWQACISRISEIARGRMPWLTPRITDER